MAQSIFPDNTASSRSRVKKSSGLFRRSIVRSRSPGVEIWTSSKEMPGNSFLKCFIVSRAWMRASLLALVPALKTADDFVIIFFVLFQRVVGNFHDLFHVGQFPDTPPFQFVQSNEVYPGSCFNGGINVPWNCKVDDERFVFRIEAGGMFMPDYRFVAGCRADHCISLSEHVREF